MTSQLGERPPLVLIANGQEWSSRSIESVLAPHGYAILKAFTGRQAIELFRTATIDVVIADSTLSDMTGPELCERLRRDAPLGAVVPMVITASVSNGREERLEAYRAGIWEYCAQPFDAEMLLLKLENFVRAKREVDRARDAGLVDETTGLYTARGLSRRAREIGAEASRRRTPVACIAVGFDDTRAFAPPLLRDDVGRRTATYLGGLFRRAGRISDAIGHVGQTEFAIIAPFTDATGAVRMVERIRSLADADHGVFARTDETIRLRAGYDALDDISGSALDVEAILVRALVALRRGRRTGGSLDIIAFGEVGAA